jgi:hypothetical protein
MSFNSNPEMQFNEPKNIPMGQVMNEPFISLGVDLLLGMPRSCKNFPDTVMHNSAHKQRQAERRRPPQRAPESLTFLTCHCHLVSMFVDHGRVMPLSPRIDIGRLW